MVYEKYWLQVDNKVRHLEVAGGMLTDLIFQNQKPDNYQGFNNFQFHGIKVMYYFNVSQNNYRACFN